MEEIKSKNLKSSNAKLLLEIKNYFQVIIENCPKDLNENLTKDQNKNAALPFKRHEEVTIHRQYIGWTTGKLSIIGIMGEIISEKIRILSKNINEPEKLKTKIIMFEKSCKTCKELNQFVQLNVIEEATNNFQKEAKEILILLKKETKKYNQNNEIESMKKELIELRSKNLNSQTNSNIHALGLFNTENKNTNNTQNENLTKNHTKENNSPKSN